MAFAGFSGIVTAFRRHDRGEWSRLDRFRFRFMVEFSLATLALSLFPFFVTELGFDESEVWTLFNPGAVDTEGARAIGGMSDEARAAHIARTPLGRVGTPADIASVAVFLVR